MRKIALLLSFLAACIFIASAHAIEFETSTGEEDIVLMSTDGEVNMGDSLSKSVEKQYQVVKDEALQKRVNDIGQKIASVCDRKDLIYHFKAIDVKDRDKNLDEPVINAFALPGGYVYVFKDLCDKVKNDDELAGVIAHEVSHIVARHSAKRMQSAIGANILMILATQTQTDNQSLGRAYTAMNSLMQAYSREDETFADKLAVKYTRKAGYNPTGVVTFLQQLWEIQKKEPLRPYISERSHPYLSIRISSAKQEISGKMDFNDYINIPTQTRR
ncbi:MAG: M48 family metallopeptidase [Candidatus Omnitrophica bacterium]|nr:M48 family metallopeptidase [Candidatus Omnitrophota bacterium]